MAAEVVSDGAGDPVADGEIGGRAAGEDGSGVEGTVEVATGTEPLAPEELLLPLPHPAETIRTAIRTPVRRPIRLNP
ncbi:MAG: hypothetical protein H0W07_02405 [Chloroflexi bacterium]|nr:hypothetical protein [Chloroflexota bacterium]